MAGAPRRGPRGLAGSLSASGAAWTAELSASLAALAPDRVLSSPLERARLLGEATARHAGIDLALDEDLKEIHRGSWQGLRVDELQERFADDVRAFYADPWTWSGHGGECDREISRRAWGALDRTLADQDCRRLVVTTHYNVIRVLACGALGIPPTRSFAFRVDTGRACLFLGREDGWHLAFSNLSRPVPPSEVAEVRP